MIYICSCDELTAEDGIEVALNQGFVPVEDVHLVLNLHKPYGRSHFWGFYEEATIIFHLNWWDNREMMDWIAESGRPYKPLYTAYADK